MLSTSEVVRGDRIRYFFKPGNIPGYWVDATVLRVDKWHIQIKTDVTLQGGQHHWVKPCQIIFPDFTEEKNDSTSSSNNS